MAERFLYEGFEPTPELVTNAKETLWRIENQSPSRSYSTGTLSKAQDGFSGSIRVSSTEGVFNVDATATTPEDVLEKLYKKIYASLLDWKRGRPEFLEEA